MKKGKFKNLFMLKWFQAHFKFQNDLHKINSSLARYEFAEVGILRQTI